ncbi:GntR family transcriptional regulator [Chromohalobacter israelensis]|uniref:GntR family transcriptional regulator n=1 Tax=Chromohalobacter israelensis TaxID=141390 RepID=UPI000FFEFB65|nr:GntR family transcriptional regulator [Chromohalobacter salexigens]RXE48209.1 GntR family transcriptional regulator [Chromohalobacter salexigens]
MARSLKEQLYRVLRDAIDAGRLEPGLVLLEGHIAEHFGMSRSPVRQTLSRLHEEGAICRFEGRGYQVGPRPGEIVRRSLGTGDFSASRIERTDTWRTFAEGVERDVVLCSMKGRFELNELQLARALSVSRSLTHRILLYLQSIGVVEKVKYSSWTVVPLDDARLRDLYQARRQLEPYMMTRAAKALEEAEIRRYLQRLDDAARAYPQVPSARLDALENDLHHEALARGNNAEIMTMLQRTRPILLISKHLLGSSIALPSVAPFFDEHRHVFDKALARDGGAAGRALDEHLARSEAQVQARLSDFREAGVIDVPDYLREVAPS